MKKRTITAIAAILAMLLIGGTATAALRYPVMGAHNFASWAGPRNNYSVIYKPTGTVYLIDGIHAIRHVRWTGWGRSTATGTGQYADGLGYWHPAKLRISGLSHEAVCALGPGASSYTRLRVTYSGVRANGWWPGGTATWNVTPTDAGC